MRATSLGLISVKQNWKRDVTVPCWEQNNADFETKICTSNEAKTDWFVSACQNLKLRSHHWQIFSGWDWLEFIFVDDNSDVLVSNETHTPRSAINWCPRWMDESSKLVVCSSGQWWRCSLQSCKKHCLETEGINWQVGCVIWIATWEPQKWWCPNEETGREFTWHLKSGQQISWWLCTHIESRFNLDVIWRQNGKPHNQSTVSNDSISQFKDKLLKDTICDSVHNKPTGQAEQQQMDTHPNQLLPVCLAMQQEVKLPAQCPIRINSTANTDGVETAAKGMGRLAF